MTFEHPGALFALLLVPVLVVGYVVDRAAARGSTRLRWARWPSAATPPGQPLGWRRHVVPAVLLLGVVVLLVALARPQATIDLPRRRGRSSSPSTCRRA